jgi:adenylate cyclase
VADEHLKGSLSRLWSLIERRLEADADTAAIDRRIWDLFGEEWTVMFTDLAGFSRGSQKFGILHFLQIIHQQRKLLLPVVADHDGILVKEDADSYIILFKRPEIGIACAIAMQQLCERVNERRNTEEQLLLCIGLGFGRILRVSDVEVFGVEVNAASKLGEDTAKAYEILVTDAVRQAAGGTSGVKRWEPIGEVSQGLGVAHRLEWR